MAARSDSMQYSAGAAGDAGQLHCHVIRRRLGNAGREFYSITVGNETNAEATVFAFASGPADSDHRTVVRTTIEARSEFSTSTAFDLPQPDSTPELHVVVGCGDVEFTLVVPGPEGDFAEQDERLKRSAPATMLLSGSGMHAVLPAIRVPYPELSPVAAFAAPVHDLALNRRNVTDVPTHSQKSPAVTPILVFFVIVMVVAACIMLRPQIGEFAVPSSASPESLVTIRYGATGLGTAAYTVLGPDGTPIAHGPVALGSGSFALKLPPARAAAPAYLVRLKVATVLGTVVAEDYLRVTTSTPAATARTAPPKRFVGRAQPTPPRLNLPQIRSLALDRATLASGETLRVYYDALAAKGSIVLSDPAAQIIYGKVAFSASGQATFVAPYVDGPRLLTVIVSAQRGSATTQSRIIVTVTPPADAGGSNLPDAGDSAAGTKGSVPRLGTAMSAPATVRSRQPIRIDVHGAPAGLVVLLLDETGAEIARRDIPNGRASTEFTAPTVRVPTRFVVTATYPSGQASEMLVRNLTVVP